MKILITGGEGFIGSNLIRYWSNGYPDDDIFCLDSRTYAANESWLNGINYNPMYVDLRNQDDVRKCIRVLKPDAVIHLGANSHVCRSIDGPKDFIHTNIVGTFNLLESFRELGNGGRFHHVSTDEVFGVAKDGESFSEQTPYDPRSPYAASKAASDHIVRAYAHTYGMDVVITNCSNNFGPNQHDEKLIPKAIVAMMNDQPVSIYGKGDQVRDWLFVVDHCRAIDTVFHKGLPCETYLVGGEMELTNLEVVDRVFQAVRTVTDDRKSHYELKYTNARPTDDQRYAINCEKLKTLGWDPRKDFFQKNLESTVSWYLSERGY